jgi:histone deacetylase 6
VLYISIHRFDSGKFYPGNPGNYKNVGEGKGRYFNINIPFNNTNLDNPVGDHEFIYAFYSTILPIVVEFEPDFIFISAGFDAA